MPDSGRPQTAADPQTMAKSRESAADSGRPHMAAEPMVVVVVMMMMRMKKQWRMMQLVTGQKAYPCTPF